MNGCRMKKLNYILAVLALGAAGAHALPTASLKDSGSPAASAPAVLGAVKDAADMDVLVQSLQSTAMVKVGFVPNSRGRVGDVTTPAGVDQGALAEVASPEESFENNGRMIVAGMVLIGVIAIRRISGGGAA
jgi:hypothetical protein